MVKKNNALMNNLKNTTTCHVMVGVVVILLIVAVAYILKANNLLNFSKMEGFENATNTMTEKPNPGPKEVVVVLFYVDWCPHCKTVKPEWAKLNKLNNTEINGVNVKVEAANAEGSEVEKEAAADNNVQGYPTIKLISESEVVDYTGARNAEDMTTFIEEYCKKL